MTTINIQPFLIVKLGNVEFTAVKADISVTNIKLFTKCDVTVSLKDENDNVLHSHSMEVNTEEYNQWNEDTFIIDLVCTKLGLTKVEA